MPEEEEKIPQEVESEVVPSKEEEEKITPENIDKVLIESTNQVEEEKITPENIDKVLDDTKPEDTSKPEVIESTNQVEEEKKEPEKSGEDTDTIEIDGEKFSQEEIDQIFATGKTVYKYKQEHPGYDPIKIHGAFTRATQELSEVKRKIVSNVDEVISKNKPIKKDVDLSKFNQKDVETFKELALGLGYVSKDELETREIELKKSNYETTKKEMTNEFLKKHPEYRPENDPNDINWNAVVNEFNRYKLPKNPIEIATILEEIHEKVSGKSSVVDTKKLHEVLAKKKVASIAQATTGAIGGGEEKREQARNNPVNPKIHNLIEKGALKGFSQKEIDELFN